MRFFTIVVALAATAAAQYPAAPAEETCSQVTVTVTKTLSHTPSAPAVQAPTGPAPYPTTAAVKPSSPAVGTGYPVVPKPSGTAKPSGTGAYSSPPAQFTGAASGLRVGGVVAAGAMAALLL